MSKYKKIFLPRLHLHLFRREVLIWLIPSILLLTSAYISVLSFVSPKTQTNSSTVPEAFVETQQEVNKDSGVTSNNVKGISNTNIVQPTPSPIQNQNTTNNPSQDIPKVSNQINPIYSTPIVNNPVPKSSPTPNQMQSPTPTPITTPTPTPSVQEVENPRISFQIYWVWLSGVGYVPEYKYNTSVCLGNLDVVWGHFYIIDPNGQEWNTGNHDYRQKPCQNMGANGTLEGKPLGEYTFKAVFDELGATKSVKATIGQPPL